MNAKQNPHLSRAGLAVQSLLLLSLKASFLQADRWEALQAVPVVSNSITSTMLIVGRLRRTSIVFQATTWQRQRSEDAGVSTSLNYRAECVGYSSSKKSWLVARLRSGYSRLLANPG